MRGHVARDLYFCLNYTLLLVYYIYYFDHKIKIAPGEFYIRCMFVHSSLTPVQCKFSTKLTPFICSAVA